jgi:hypothetical protein
MLQSSSAFSVHSSLERCRNAVKQHNNIVLKRTHKLESGIHLRKVTQESSTL